MASFRDQYRCNPGFAGLLGAEEEFWTTDPRTGRLTSASLQLFREMSEDGLRPELPDVQVESVSGACRTVAGLAAELEANRTKLRGFGRTYGFVLDTRPTPWHSYDVRVFPKPRYERILAQVGKRVMKHAWIIGLHIHTGGHDPDELVVLNNGLRVYLPMFLALSARSPQYLGQSRGRASERFFSYLKIMDSLKCGFVPPFLRSWEHFEQLAREQGFLEDPKRCWWALRPNPVGTCELRICDMQEQSFHSAELAALYRVCARRVLAHPQDIVCTPSEFIRAELVEVASSPAARDRYKAQLEAAMRFAAEAHMQEEHAYLQSLYVRLFWSHPTTSAARG